MKLQGLFYILLFNSDNFVEFKYAQVGEVLMLEVTDAATVKIAEYFRGKEVAPIRIFLNEGG